MTVTSHHTIDDLQKSLRSTRDVRVHQRLRAVILAMRGREHDTIAEQLGQCPRWVEKWVARYNKGGLDSLADRPRSGQPVKLPSEKIEVFKARVRVGPTVADGGRSVLYGHDFTDILRREFGVKYSLPGVYQLLHRLGFSSLRPRPRHLKNDPDAMKDWEARAPFLSRASAANTRINKSKSGSRTRPASDRRAR
jgi:transposase